MGSKRPYIAAMNGEVAAALLGVVGGLVVAMVSGWLATRLERQKQRAGLEAQAVVDVGRAIAMTAITSEPGAREHARILFADAKLRLAAYGRGEAARALGTFIDAGASTSTSEGRHALVQMVQAVRRRTLPLRGRRLDWPVVETLLFGEAVPGLGGIDSWEQAAAQVRADIAVVPDGVGRVPAPPADGSVASAIAASFAKVEERLRRLLLAADVDPGNLRGDQLAGLAMERRLIDGQTAHAVGGLQVMHDLAVTLPEGQRDDPQRAAEYAALVAGTLYAMDATSRATRGSGNNVRGAV